MDYVDEYENNRNSLRREGMADLYSYEKATQCGRLKVRSGHLFQTIIECLVPW